jgi:hypothetical protein
MKVSKLVCDRCGKDAKEGDGINVTGKGEGNGRKVEVHFDLCPDCKKNVTLWSTRSLRGAAAHV